MKKIILLLMAGLFVSVAKASVIPPADARGTSLYNTDFVGAIPCEIDNSTGTSYIVCNATQNGVAFSGGGVVYGVITSSVNPTDYLVFKDTTGLGTTGYLAGQTGAGSLQSVGSTVAVVQNTYQIQTTTNPTGQAMLGIANFIKFPVPLQFQYGIVANASATPISNNGLSRWTILWRPLLTVNLKNNQ